MTDGRLSGSYGMETLRRLKLQQQGPRPCLLPRKFHVHLICDITSRTNQKDITARNVRDLGAHRAHVQPAQDAAQFA